MTNLTESPIYTSGIYQLETTDPVLGGAPGFSGPTPVTGHANAQAQQLANRTAYLKNRIDVDLANSSDPAKGAALVGRIRQTLLDDITSVADALDATLVNPWEYADLVTSRPNPLDPSGWNWVPALNAAFLEFAGKAVRIEGGSYTCSGNVTTKANTTVEFTGGAHLSFSSGALQVEAGCTLIRPSIDGKNKTNAAEGIKIPAGAGNIRLIQPKVRQVFSNAIDNSSGSDDIWIIEPDIDDIGGEAANPAFQACGVYSAGDRTRVIGGRISRTLGQGAVFINGGDDHSIVDVHMHDTRYRAVMLFGNPTNVLVAGNKIRRTGELLIGPSAVGANGIFCIAAQASDVVVIGNDIADVAENAIEGVGTFIDNVIDGTHYHGLTTPSIEGIFLSFDAVCRGNIIRNAAGAGIKTFHTGANGKVDICDNVIFDPGSAGISVQVDGASASYLQLNVDNNTIYGANDPAQGGINIIRSGGSTILSGSAATRNTVFGRDTNSISSGVARQYDNSFDPRNAYFGDSPTTSTAAKSPLYTMIYNVPITSGKVALANLTNPSRGERLRVVRTAACTGAFNVTLTGSVGLKALSAASTWAEAEYDGSAWVLVAAGTL